ncbi:MAG: two-component system nitrogen regulation response regulator NtrX [Gammaproteobacteria bacterium]|jgi:two-component system nitrogen regulation response regulator NtrX
MESLQRKAVIGGGITVGLENSPQHIHANRDPDRPQYTDIHDHFVTQPMPRILIAEDNDDNREILSEFLTDEGHEVTTAGNAADAIALAVKLRPALILMDLQMSDSDSSPSLNDSAGVTAASFLRAHSTTVTIPIVALSGYNLSSADPSIEAGRFTCVASKPFDFAELASLITTLLETA